MRRKKTLPLFTAVLLALAGCDGTPPSPPQASAARDVTRDRVWSLTPYGVRVHPRAAPQAAVVLTLPAWHWAGPPYGCLPALALGPKGEAVITSDTVPTLWRIDADTLAITVHELALDADNDRDVGFSEIVWSHEAGAWLAVSHIHGSYWQIDPQLRHARKVAPPALRTTGCRRLSFSS